MVFRARVAPNVNLPMAHGMLLLVLGGAAALFWVLVTLQWIDYILEPPIFTVDTIQFLIGLVASLVMLFAGWRAYQADKGTAGRPAGGSPGSPRRLTTARGAPSAPR